MLYLALVVFVVSIGILTARAARHRGVPQGSLAATGLRVVGSSPWLGSASFGLASRSTPGMLTGAKLAAIPC